MAGRSSAAGPVVESRRFPGQCWRIRDIGGQWLASAEKFDFGSFRAVRAARTHPYGYQGHERKFTAVRRALRTCERHKEMDE